MSLPVILHDKAALARESSLLSKRSVLFDSDVESLIVNDRKLIRRIDLRLLPWLCLLYALSLVDRNNIGGAMIAGMDRDLHMDDNNSYSIALLVFFPGYFIFDFVGSFVIRRVGAANLLSFIVIGWGGVTIGMGFVQSWRTLAVCRAVLGLFEGGLFSGCVYLICCWYKRYEVQTRLAFFTMASSLAYAFTGILGYGLMQIHTSTLAGWRWIYIVEGAMTVTAGIVAWFFIVDFPQKAKFLHDYERERIIQRLNKDRGDAEHDQITPAKICTHLSDWKLWVFGLMFFCVTAPSYGLAFFIPVILNDVGFSVSTTFLLIAPPYILSLLVALGTSYWADRVRLRTPFIICHSIVAIAGFGLMASTVRPAVKLVGVFLALSGSAPNIPAVLAFAQNNILSTSKRAVTSGFQIGFGAIGGIAASTVFRAQDAPRYIPGLITMLCCEGIIIFAAGSLAIYFYRMNKMADREKIVVLEGREGFRYTT